MNLRLVQRRMVWWPTRLGCVVLFLVAGASTLLCWFQAEAFFSPTVRKPATVLVVESWIGLKGLQAARTEFERGGYLYLVSAGGLSINRWEAERRNFAEAAQVELVRLGVSQEKIIVARQKDQESQRTYSTAVAAWQALRAAGIQPKAINVFTVGVHARRSRLVFAKVFRPDTEVGVVAWIPPGYEAEPWWRSSDRIEVLIKEAVGWIYEAVLNSGRTSNSPIDPATPNR